MKHPSEDYDVTTCRFQKGSREHRALVYSHHEPMQVFSYEFVLTGLARRVTEFPDLSLEVELLRDGACVAQWAVIR